MQKNTLNQNEKYIYNHIISSFIDKLFANIDYKKLYFIIIKEMKHYLNETNCHQ